MKKALISFMIVLSTVFGVSWLNSTPVFAADNECDTSGSKFFSLKPWYAGLVDESSCSIKNPNELEGTDDADRIAKFVWTIVLNILFDITVMVGYIAIIVIAWGGYLYMFSRGDVGRAERGKKTLIAAVIGLVIAMLASVIMNTISVILTGK